MGWISGPCEPDDHEEMVILEQSEPKGDGDGSESLLHQLAADPDSGMIKLADGVWWQPKLRPDRDKLS